MGDSAGEDVGDSTGDAVSKVTGEVVGEGVGIVWELKRLVMESQHGAHVRQSCQGWRCQPAG